MSKTRPRKRSAHGGPGPPSWRRRVFRNTYTVGGRLATVKGWHVKIQHCRRRHTFSLKAASRNGAATQAEAIYQTIVLHGWEHALRSHAHRHGRPRVSASTSSEAPESSRPQGGLSAAEWKHRLIQRKYCEMLTPLAGCELSARVERDGVHHYFPLGTDLPARAAAKARRIYQYLLAHGWERTCAHYPREITLGIFWSRNPVACTYATLHTLTSDAPLTAQAASVQDEPRHPVWIVEPEGDVRAALSHWLDRQRGWHCTMVAGDAREALKRIVHARPALLLINRAIREMPIEQALQHFHDRQPDLPVFPYGIYDDSDQFFGTLSGVVAGYILRRRKPTALLEPLRDTGGAGTLTARNATRMVKHYFQSFFDASASGEAPTDSTLTTREEEILSYISKGYLDKEIAVRLEISVWTVHNHLKNIYGKLRVHSRTEAAVKYLQK